MSCCKTSVYLSASLSFVPTDEPGFSAHPTAEQAFDFETEVQ